MSSNYTRLLTILQINLLITSKCLLTDPHSDPNSVSISTSNPQRHTTISSNKTFQAHHALLTLSTSKLIFNETGKIFVGPEVCEILREIAHLLSCGKADAVAEGREGEVHRENGGHGHGHGHGPEDRCYHLALRWLQDLNVAERDGKLCDGDDEEEGQEQEQGRGQGRSTVSVSVSVSVSDEVRQLRKELDSKAQKIMLQEKRIEALKTDIDNLCADILGSNDLSKERKLEILVHAWSCFGRDIVDKNNEK